VAGYKGDNCEIDINECLLSESPPCSEHGKCVDEVNGYKCECHKGFEGRKKNYILFRFSDSDEWSGFLKISFF